VAGVRPRVLVISPLLCDVSADGVPSEEAQVVLGAAACICGQPTRLPAVRGLDGPRHGPSAWTSFCSRVRCRRRPAHRCRSRAPAPGRSAARASPAPV